MFSTTIFGNLYLEIEWVLRCKAIELVSCLERVVEVKPTYVLFSLDI